MEDHSPAPRSRAGLTAATAILATALSIGCTTPYIGTTAASYLRRVRESRDPNIRYVAYAKLASPHCYDDDQQKSEAVRIMVKNLESDREPVATRAVICRTLGEIRNPDAREALVKATGDPDGIVRAEACRALGKVGKTEDATVLARIMTVDTLEDCRVAAIEALGDLKAKDPRIEVLLVEGMENDDPATRLASLRSLRKITGKDLGVKVGPWRDYIRKHVDSAEPAKQIAQAPTR
jgi:HEAT repeat protein